MLGVMAVAAVGAAPAAAEPIEIGHIPKCTEAVPAAVAIPPGDTIALDVRVLLDGVDQGRATEIFNAVRRAYAPLGIAVVTSYQGVSFSGEDAESLIAQSKAVFGGSRPAGVDVVYTLTSSLGGGETVAVAGLADCIGGVAFPDRAFAVGANLDDFFLGPVTSLNRAAKVAAHEIGHLLGGHHQYANCVEGLLAELGEDTTPCSLMFNEVTLSSLRFSVVNGLVVRGHAEAYAAG